MTSYTSVLPSGDQKQSAQLVPASVRRLSLRTPACDVDDNKDAVSNYLNVKPSRQNFFLGKQVFKVDGMKARGSTAKGELHSKRHI